MSINVATLAELVGLAAVIAGGYILAGLGGLVLAIGACLLYEARP